MSLKTPEQVMQSSNALPSIGSTVCHIDPLSERMDAITETSGASDASVPDVEIELLDQQGIEGIHLYFK